MTTEKQNVFRRAKIFYVFVFVLGAFIILPAHIFPPPTFMYARFPHYLEMMKPFLGISWPLSFEIYHYGLYALAVIGSLNVLGIFFPKFAKLAFFSSLIGLFLISLMILFFFFIFISVNAPTAVIYGLYLVLLLIVDLLTFNAIRRKEASRE